MYLSIAHAANLSVALLWKQMGKNIEGVEPASELNTWMKYSGDTDL